MPARIIFGILGLDLKTSLSPWNSNLDTAFATEYN